MLSLLKGGKDTENKVLIYLSSLLAAVTWHHMWNQLCMISFVFLPRIIKLFLCFQIISHKYSSPNHRRTPKWAIRAPWKITFLHTILAKERKEKKRQKSWNTVTLLQQGRKKNYSTHTVTWRQNDRSKSEVVGNYPFHLKPISQDFSTSHCLLL